MNIEVRIGPQTVDWYLIEPISRAFDTLNLREIMPTFRLGPISAINVMVIELCTVLSDFRQGETLTLVELLLRTKRCKATDARDHVFSLLNLASDSWKMDIVPDYGHDADLTLVYKSAAQEILQSSGLWDILFTEKYVEDIETYEFPSWVPDWRMAGSVPSHITKLDPILRWWSFASVR